MQARQSLEYMRYAKPWQKMLLTVALLALGVTLIILGRFVGLVPLVLGLLFIRPTARSLRIRGRTRNR